MGKNTVATAKALIKARVEALIRVKRLTGKAGQMCDCSLVVQEGTESASAETRRYGLKDNKDGRFVTNEAGEAEWFNLDQIEEMLDVNQSP